jgi:hypothetical protein
VASRIALLLVIGLIAAASTAAASAASGFRTCGRFIVGRANSTAYPNMQLPARGRETGSSCVVLRRIARRIQAGTYRIPAWAWAPSPAFGAPFLIRDEGRDWACDVQNNGSSGPSYAVRCDRTSARLSWSTG